MTAGIHFGRKPYETYYYKDGERHTYRRRPPEKLHNIWPEDIVSLAVDKNTGFEEGDEVEVVNFNARHPNVLKLENDDGDTTFVEYFDVELEDEVGPRDTGGDLASPTERNRYLLWP